MSNEKLFARIKSLTVPKSLLHGWCTYEKSLELVKIVLALSKPAEIVEIGVFGGSSLVPLAMAVEELGEGRVVGIDPWSGIESVKGMVNETNIQYWGDVNLVYGEKKGMDYSAIKASCTSFVAINKLKKWVKLVQSTAHDAVKDFADGSIDLLHIDGNHSADAVMQDVVDWMPKMKPNGWIVMDDVGWTEGQAFTVRPAVEYLTEHGWETDNPMKEYLIMRRVA